jgi:hypothetical protein
MAGGDVVMSDDPFSNLLSLIGGIVIGFSIRSLLMAAMDTFRNFEEIHYKKWRR